MAGQRGTGGGASGRGDGVALAWFVSAHGLGHAARAAAVMAATSRLRPDLRHHVFTTVPRWFFDDSLPDSDVRIHRLDCDVGMVQRDALSEDVDGTVEALSSWLSASTALLDRASSRIVAAGCCAVIADIAPLGLAVARAVGVPAVLVENFTWDWIYHSYRNSELEKLGARLAQWFELATLRIQAEPVCDRRVEAVQVPPASRACRSGRDEVRRRLGVQRGQRLVLIGQGSTKPDRSRLTDLGLNPDKMLIVVPDPAATAMVAAGGILTTPAAGGLYHPDLVAACDLVIAKLGYSTVAEAVRAGTPLAYLRRPRFPESPILEAFVRERLPSMPLSSDWLDDPASGCLLEGLTRSPRPAVDRGNGADQAAAHILRHLRLRF